MDEGCESQDYPTLKTIRHEFVGFSKIGKVTIRERQIPESYALRFVNTSCDKKQFYLNCSKEKFGSDEASKLRSLQILRRAKVRKPIKTTGESDAKIRMPPPKFPPPWSCKKKADNDSKSSEAMLKPTLKPVEARSKPEKNYLNFVPFELQKQKRTQSPTRTNSPANVVQTDSETTKPSEKTGRAARMLASKRRKHKIVKKLKPMFKPGESKPVISDLRMRKLVDMWATKLASVTSDIQSSPNSKHFSSSSKTCNQQTNNNRVNFTNVRKSSSVAPDNFTRSEQQNPYSFSHRCQKPPETTERTSLGSTNTCASPTPTKSYVYPNPLVNQTIELLRFKRDVEAKIETFDAEPVVSKIPPLPVIIKRPPKGELTLESIPMTNEEVNNVLMKRIAVLLAHAGFTHSKLLPMEILADCLQDFLLKMSSRLKQIRERELAGVDHEFPDPMERTLVELGMGGVRGLEDFYETKVVNYHRRMADTCMSLRRQYTSMLHNKIGFSAVTPSVPTGISVVLDSSSGLDETILAPVQNNGLPNTSPSL